MIVYLRAKFEVFSIILTSCKHMGVEGGAGSNFTPLAPTSKRTRFQISVKKH